MARLPTILQYDAGFAIVLANDAVYRLEYRNGDWSDLEEAMQPHLSTVWYLFNSTPQNCVPAQWVRNSGPFLATAAADADSLKWVRKYYVNLLILEPWCLEELMTRYFTASSLYIDLIRFSAIICQDRMRSTPVIVDTSR